MRAGGGSEQPETIRTPRGTASSYPSLKPVPPTPVLRVTTPWSAGSVARSRFAKVCEKPTFNSPYSGTAAGANVPDRAENIWMRSVVGHTGKPVFWLLVPTELDCPPVQTTCHVVTLGAASAGAAAAAAARTGARCRTSISRR